MAIRKTKPGKIVTKSVGRKRKTRKSRSRSAKSERFYVELPKSKVIHDGDLHVVIGFDISSTTTGIAVLYLMDGYIHHAQCEYYKPIKKDMSQLQTLIKLRTDIRATLRKVRNKIADMARTLGCSMEDHVKIHIGAEDFLMFVPNRSSAGTVTTLSIFNRVTCLAAYDEIGVVPELFPVMTIRSVLRKMSCSSARVDKENVPAVCEKLISERHISGAWKFLWFTGRNGVVEENYDMGDAIAAAIACAYHNHLIA
jgi:hypothetical protein